MLYIQPNMLTNYVIFKNKLINVNVIEMRIHAANMTFFLNKESIIPLQQISITPGLQKNTKIYWPWELRKSMSVITLAHAQATLSPSLWAQKCKHTHTDIKLV